VLIAQRPTLAEENHGTKRRIHRHAHDELMRLWPLGHRLHGEAFEPCVGPALGHAATAPKRGALALVVLGGRSEQHDPVARRGLGGPARGRSGRAARSRSRAVQHEVDVHLVVVPVVPAHGVGAHDGALALVHHAPLPEPVVTGVEGDSRRVLVRLRQEQGEALVAAAAGEVAEGFAAEPDPDHRRPQAAGLDHAGRKEAELAVHERRGRFGFGNRCPRRGWEGHDRQLTFFAF